jgi:phenylalanyl-tRNA synthetase beta chain
MNIQILHSWLTEYIQTDATPEQIAQALALCGPSVETVNATQSTTKNGKPQKDWVYDIEITTNRVDMMSVIGVAREAAAILPGFGYKTTYTPLKVKKLPKPAKELPLTLKHDPKLSGRVMALVMDNIKVSSSPKWLQDRLEAAGIRSLNNIIDITNYIMTEVGHPTHVFDYDRIKDHTLRFREAKSGEKITTLDDKTYKLPGGDIVIVDSKDNIIDLPGIMGTKNSVVTNETQRIIFFIDNNDPVQMRKTSMTLGIRSVAVTLNEKRVDPELGMTAMLRGAQLYHELVGAQVSSSLHDHYTDKPKVQTLKISTEFINARLGVEAETKFITDTLETLGFKTSSKGNQLKISVPSWRTHDVTISEDIVEEISRIYGYHNLPSIVPLQEPPLPSKQAKNFYWEAAVKQALKHWGYFESYSYSLISKEQIESIKADPKTHLKLKNPLSSDWLYMRRSIVPSLLLAMKDNQDKQAGLKFFEMANVYHPVKDKLPQEVMTLTLVQNGKFLELKGTLEALSEELGVTFNWKLAKGTKHLSPQTQADIYIGNNKVGSAGELASDVSASLGLKQGVVVAELELQHIIEHATKNKTYTPIPKHPPIIENLTFFNDNQVSAEQILDAATGADTLIYSAKIVDSYQNKLTLEVSYLNRQENLTDKQVKPLRQKLVKAVEKLGTKIQGEV